MFGLKQKSKVTDPTPGKVACPKCGGKQFEMRISLRCRSWQNVEGRLEANIQEDKLETVECVSCHEHLDVAKVLETVGTCTYGDPEWGGKRYLCGILKV